MTCMEGNHSPISIPTMGPYMEGFDEDEAYQAMEAFVYNLNTMHSRAGAQVPFSTSQCRLRHISRRTTCYKAIARGL